MLRGRFFDKDVLPYSVLSKVSSRRRMAAKTPGRVIGHPSFHGAAGVSLMRICTNPACARRAYGIRSLYPSRRRTEYRRARLTQPR